MIRTSINPGATEVRVEADRAGLEALRFAVDRLLAHDVDVFDTVKLTEHGQDPNPSPRTFGGMLPGLTLQTATAEGPLNHLVAS